MHFSSSRRRILLAIAAAIGSDAGAAARPGPDERSAPLQHIAERYFADAMDQNPFWASSFGVATPRQAAALQMDIAPGYARRMRAIGQRTLAQLDRLAPTRLPEADRVLLQLLRHQCTDDLANLAFPWRLLPMDQMAQSVPFLLAEPVANGLCTFATADDYRSHLDRLNQLPDWCDQAVANLREGARTQVVQPAVIIERMLPMLRGLCESGAWLAPLDAWPEGVAAGQPMRCAATTRVA